MAKDEVKPAQPKSAEPKAKPESKPAQPKSVRYKATARGYCGVKIREPGEVFDFSGKPGHWMVPLKEAKAAAKAESDAAPEGESQDSDESAGSVI